ncbi:MAG TPA: acyl-CoA dehydrogenase family protein, partial [Nitrospiria bacterium]
AMVARIEAWRLILSLLLRRTQRKGFLEGHPEWQDLCATISAMAFAPDPGRMGYDAGQVFGGFAYSEDDLLSRAYRDSAIFRFLRPGVDAPRRMAELYVDAKAMDARVAETRPAFEEIRGGPLVETAEQWDAQYARWKNLRPASASMQTGEAAALLMGLRWTLLDIHDRIEAGQSAEAEALACAVLVDLAEQAVDAMEVWRSDATAVPVAVFPERPDRKPVSLPLSYEQICTGKAETAGLPYQSGQYLREAFDSSPRFVPEIQMHDSPLRSRWEESNAWFLENIWTQRFDGMHIERYVDKLHKIPKGTLDGYKKRGYFSTVIPAELDGGGWWKAEYYILTTAAGRYGDAGLLLVIMASTSIGTTPVILGLEDEIPLAEEELKPLGLDSRRLGEIGEKLEGIIDSLKRPDPARLKKSFSELMALVDARIRKTRVVKYLAANFLKTFYAAGISGQRRDLEGFIRGLKDARLIFSRLGPTVQEAIEELPRRRRAHEFFLRQLGHGGISAFALTEPTAGSDTGGVKTTARLKASPLFAMDDGRHRFHLNDGGKSAEGLEDPRYLIDADRVEFGDSFGFSGMGYRTPSGEVAPIRCDDYNYDTDEGLRYYEYQGKKRPFHDIAQVRTREGRPVYEYYEISGSKMWITNGHVATQFCLYAQSPEGVTGFMLDRHSEGLKVGADERKMGQRGSPTNEIAIDQARIPREGVIGYEGHGQVNALETLNVGRCGLATASITIMRKLLTEAIEQVPASAGRDRLLSEAAAILFGAECMTFYLIGLFDRESTESVRMESAIAKFVTSEDLHEVLTLIERAYGPTGLTETYRVEKLRRDSRILNIYEGTSEVQRFLILKDLLASAKTWRPVAGDGASGAIGSLAKWKECLRENVVEAAERFGETAWMDAVLQPTYFPLADMGGEIFRLDCLIYRINWLQEH